MTWAFILHLGVVTVALSAILLGFKALMGAYDQDADSERENYNILAGFLLVGGILVAVGGLGMILSR